MSQIIDKILNDVCLSSRIPDGVFRLEEDEHMGVLRDYLVKKGIPNNDVVSLHNKILEGRFPQRQAFNKDGILCTFPTPKHKADAIKRGSHFEKNPNPQNTTAPREEPVKEPVKQEPPTDTEKPEDDATPGDDQGARQNNIFNREPEKIVQGDKELKIEPRRGMESPTAIKSPAASTVITPPRTPRRVAAEKEVVSQIFNTSNNNLSNIEPYVDEACRLELNELYKKADELGLKRAVTFLTPYVKS